MSLVSFGLRLAVCRLLEGRTWAQERIHNSPIDPVTEVVRGDDDGTVDPRPLIAVFTNDEKGGNEGRDIGGRAGSLDLIFFIYLPPDRIEINDGDMVFESREPGGAMALDLLWHQCRTALLFGTAAWRQVYERFVNKVTDVRARPILIETERGSRIPAKEVILTLDVVPEPDLGKPMTVAWQALDAAMRADDNAAPLADLIKGMIEQPDDLSSWELQRANLAVSEATIQALGLAPMDPTETGEAAELEEIEFSGENVVEPPVGVP